jgi:hypothetical protein
MSVRFKAIFMVLKSRYPSSLAPSPMKMPFKRISGTITYTPEARSIPEAL